jgi:hypothetical protein
VGEWKDPPDASDYARCYYELDQFLVLSLSHDGEFRYLFSVRVQGIVDY